MRPLLAVSGSLRKDSFNTRLAQCARDLVAPSIPVQVATLHGIPLYDGDLEAGSGTPDAVEALRERVLGSAGVMLFSPEYNNGIPGVFKNAIDWLSRPSDRIAEVFGGRPFAVAGASPGGFGTVMAQAAWLPVLRALGVQAWAGGRVLLSRAGSAFDDAGRLVEPRTRDQLREFVEGFDAFCRARERS